MHFRYGPRVLDALQLKDYWNIDVRIHVKFRCTTLVSENLTVKKTRMDESA